MKPAERCDAAGAVSSAAWRDAATILYDRLIDDAAMFPPKMADLHTALSGRLANRDCLADRYVGSFLVPAGRATDLLDALEAAPQAEPLSVGVVASEDPMITAEAVARLMQSDQVELALVEMRLDPAAEPKRALAEAASAAGDGRCETGPRVLCEVPHVWLDDHRLAAALGTASKTGLGAKLRTGGATADAFPDVPAVARFISACVAHRVAFKCTAGLHHAVRRHDSASSLVHHGFANVLLATRLALTAAPAEAVDSALYEQHPARIAARLNEVDPAEAAMIRRVFLSYGSCDTITPVKDILELLVPAP